MTDTRSSPATEQEYLEDNIATVAFALGQPGARLSVSGDRTNLVVDPGEVLAEVSRRLSVAQQPVDCDIIEIAKDLAALWQNPKIQGLARSDRNAAIEDTRKRLIAAVAQFGGITPPDHRIPLSAVPPSPVAGERSDDVHDWISYADRLEKVLEVVAGSSTDALKRSQAQEGLRLVRPPPVSSTHREDGK